MARIPRGAADPSVGGAGFQFPIGQDIYQQLIQQAISAATAPRPSSQDILAQGINSPMLQMIIQQALKALIPGEAEARSGLTEQFRAAGPGALRSGAFGREAGRLEGTLQEKRGGATTDALLKFLAPLLQAGLTERGQDIQAGGMFADILGRLPNPVYRDPAGGNVATSRGGGGIEDPFGVLSGGTNPLYERNVAQTRGGGGGTAYGGELGVNRDGGVIDLDALLQGGGFTGGAGISRTPAYDPQFPTYNQPFDPFQHTYNYEPEYNYYAGEGF